MKLITLIVLVLLSSEGYSQKVWNIECHNCDEIQGKECGICNGVNEKVIFTGLIFNSGRTTKHIYKPFSTKIKNGKFILRDFLGNHIKFNLSNTLFPNTTELKEYITDCSCTKETVARFVQDSLGVWNYIDELGDTTRLAPLADACELLDINLKVFLEGPYLDGSDEMTTDLNIGGYIPTSQPYANVDPFYNTTAITNDDINATDWVLVKFRTIANNTASTVLTLPALLLKDGSIEFTELCNTALNLDLNVSYSITVQHRNHLGIESPTLIAFSGNALTYDFTTQNSLQLGGDGQKQMNDGSWVMYAGNAQQELGDYNFIQDLDNTRFQQDAGQIGYLQGDMNLNGDVINIDAQIWSANYGQLSSILF